MRDDTLENIEAMAKGRGFSHPKDTLLLVAEVRRLRASAAVKDQPAPSPNTSKPIWELVIKDMQERDLMGRERYGTPLQAHNGRDALTDAYQEALDLAVYLRQAIEERRLPRIPDYPSCEDDPDHVGA